MSISRLSNYEWVETNSPVASSRTDDIDFFDAQHGWLVNSNGQVAETTDGGDTWEVKLQVPPNLPAMPYLRTVAFANPEKGWVGALVNAKADPEGYQNQLLRMTEDGGDTWTNLELPEGSPGGICGLSVVNENVIYGSGSNNPADVGAGIVKTTDGGKTWELIDMTPWATNLIDIHFFDENTGWVVGGKANDACSGEVPPEYQGDPQYFGVKPVVLYTEDGGKTWENRVTELSFPCGEWGWKLFFVSPQEIFVSLENFIEGAILKSLDGGNTWERLPINDSRPVKFGQEVSNANLEGIGFIDTSFGWVGGWGDANFVGTYNSVTEDGGHTWKAEDFAVNGSGQSVGDVRVNVNRFLFFGDPVETGYCSGKKVYKLVVKDLDKTSQVTAAKSSNATFKGPGTSPHAVGAFGLHAETHGDGGLTVHYNVPEKAGEVHLGLWNHFGFHIQTLVDAKDVSAGPHSITWNPAEVENLQTSGGIICRLTIDGRTESETVSLKS